MEQRILLLILGVAGLAAIIYFLSIKDNFEMEVMPVPTSPEIEYIEGGPNVHGVNPATGMEVIPVHDISLKEGYGASAGNFGFGRTGSTFMV